MATSIGQSTKQERTITKKESSTKKLKHKEHTTKHDEIHHNSFIVAAIDFGTVHSGFAYSFKGDQENIKSAEHGGMLQQDRVPTILLLNPNKTFHSFGYNAQTYFNELPREHRSKFYYFENFKMKLYDNVKIDRKMVILDISGKPFEAMQVFSIAIEHLKDEASKIVYASKIGLKETAIQWMITIPAISSDSARQFMREASTRAGIPQSRLRLVLEPEAAALYSRHRIMTEEMPCGFKYVLADLGGGTSDICVHKTLNDGKLQELYRATGEASGGTEVDSRFINMMKTLTGEEVWREFASTYSLAYIGLVNEFREKKKEFRSDTVALTLKMENALVHVIDGKLKKNLSEIIEESKYAGKLEYHSIEARLKINREMLKELFTPSVERIIDKLNEVVDNCTDSEIKTLILVGGFSESLYVREIIQSEFGYMRVVLVDDARLAVLNGAVLMGWRPQNIFQRRSRYTYGFSIRRIFKNDMDPEDLKYLCENTTFCKRVFLKLISKGDLMEFGKTFSQKGFGTAKAPERKSSKRALKLYRSTKMDPQYCIEEDGCSLVGQLVVSPTDEGWPNVWSSEFQLVVGETEFTVKYFNCKTKIDYEAHMDFL